MVEYHVYDLLSGMTPFGFSDIDGEPIVLKTRKDCTDESCVFIKRVRVDKNIVEPVLHPSNPEIIQCQTYTICNRRGQAIDVKACFVRLPQIAIWVSESCFVLAFSSDFWLEIAGR